MTALGGVGHTFPFLIHDFRFAMGLAIVVVLVELASHVDPAPVHGTHRFRRPGVAGGIGRGVGVRDWDLIGIRKDRG